MKHYVRAQTRHGSALLANPPTMQVITHEGSGQQYTQRIEWRKTTGGVLSATGSFTIPPGAKLGLYQVQLQGDRGQSFDTGEFRVEEFRLPVLEGRVEPSARQPLVNVKELPADVQVNYVSGGPAVNLPVRVSALMCPHGVAFADYEAFSFAPPSGWRAARPRVRRRTKNRPERMSAWWPTSCPSRWTATAWARS
jgi:uncharacterized protein YfaS (alpha-2-macroglobulin family)